MTDASPALGAGAIAGAVAFLVFMVVHGIWIVPIWGIVALAPFAALIGALAAWPFHELSMRGALPPAPADGVAFALMLLASLGPTIVVGILAGPVDPHHISVAALLLPLVLAAPAGAAIGLLLTGSTVAAASLALAAVALALTLGHNLPFFPVGTSGWPKAVTLVVFPELAAGLAFSIARALLPADHTRVMR